MDIGRIVKFISTPHGAILLGVTVVAAAGVNFWIDKKHPHGLLQWLAWSVVMMLILTIVILLGDEGDTTPLFSGINPLWILGLGVLGGGVVTMHTIFRRRRGEAAREATAKAIALEKARYGRQPPLDLG